MRPLYVFATILGATFIAAAFATGFMYLLLGLAIAVVLGAMALLSEQTNFLAED